MEHLTVAPQGVLVREAWLEEGHLSGRQETREELAERPDKRQRAYIADIPEPLLIQSGGASGGV